MVLEVIKGENHDPIGFCQAGLYRMDKSFWFGDIGIIKAGINLGRVPNHFVQQPNSAFQAGIILLAGRLGFSNC